MKIALCLTICLCTTFYIGNGLIHQAMAQDPLISLTAEQEPLGDILETITQATGYTFNLNKEWREYPVSATIDNLPVEKGLKRLLRSLNHTIIWESDRIITIRVFNKVAPNRPKPAASPSLSPRRHQITPEPIIEPKDEPADQTEPVEQEADGEEQDTDEESVPEEDTPEIPSDTDEQLDEATGS